MSDSQTLVKYKVSAILIPLYLLCVAITDAITPLGIAVPMLYVPAIFAVFFLRSFFALNLVAIASAILTVIGYFLSSDIGVSWQLPTTNRALALFVILTTTYLVRIALVYELHIQELHELITMCAWTKKVKVKGEWVPIEDFIKKYMNLRISHGISPEAAAATAAEADRYLYRSKAKRR